MVKTRYGTGLAFACITALVCLAGCNVDARWTRMGGPDGPEAPKPGGQHMDQLLSGDTQEVDMVEAVVGYRDRYHRSLQQLHDFYVAKGYATKADWAAYELAGLGKVRQFLYVLDAELPSPSLRATDQIPEADVLLEKGRELMRRGGHGVPALYREDRMIQAVHVFRKLIDHYPTSDKIDDAAFYLGEIHKEYLKGQDTLAVQWYERVWTWDPATTHPARFQAAVVCDYRLHDRDRALELYQGVIDHETLIKSNTRWATRRIYELTRDMRTAGTVRP